MQTQLEMPIRMRRTDEDRAREDAETLVAQLRGFPALCGRPSAQVCDYLGWADRRLRAAAEASAGRVLSAPGCTGYRLAESTPVDSYYANERARYQSQIRVMQRRLSEMDRAVHGVKTGGRP